MSVAIEKSRTNVYLDARLKGEAKMLFKQYGLGLSEAINIFLGQAVAQRGLPFEMRLPNEETAQAIRETRAGVNLEETSIEAIGKGCDTKETS